MAEATLLELESNLAEVSLRTQKTCVIAEQCPDKPVQLKPALAGCGFECRDCPNGDDPMGCDLLLIHMEASDHLGRAEMNRLAKKKNGAKLLVIYEGRQRGLPELFDSMAKAQGADRVLASPLSPERLSKTLAELGLAD